MPTPDIFDFKVDRLDDYDDDRVAVLLAEQPEVYVNHLRIAKSIDQWVANLRTDRNPVVEEQDPNNQYAAALEEVAAHLRQGDYVNGGLMLQDDAAALQEARRRNIH